jgi:hypothetical protein
MKLRKSACEEQIFNAVLKNMPAVRSRLLQKGVNHGKKVLF